MRGLIFNIRSFSVHDGPGIRQTIFFKGCPLNCAWCHNPESRNPASEKWRKTTFLAGKRFEETETIGRWVSTDELMQEILKDVPFYEESGGGVTLSGGEPLAQSEFAAELLMKCKEAGIHCAIDTCGFAEPTDVERIIPHADLFLYDLKIADDIKHTEYTGKSNQLILENLKLISEKGKKIHIRLPLVEEITDTASNLEEIRKIILRTKGVERLDLLPYHFSAKPKYERLNKEFQNISQKNYPSEKALKIKEFFHNVSPFVSIGG